MKLLRLLLLSLLLFIPVLPTTGMLWSAPLVLQDPNEIYDLNAGVHFFIDSTGGLDPEEVVLQQSHFRPLKEDYLQLPRDGAVWLYLEIENSTSSTAWIIENNLSTELMELYLSTPQGWVLDQRTGNLVPYVERTLKTRLPSFQVLLPKNGVNKYLIRIFDYQSSGIQLHIAEAVQFQQSLVNRNFFLGAIFGFFIALVIYNLIVYVMNREKAFLLYALYMTAFLFNQLAQERYFSKYITPNEPYGFFWFMVFGSATALLGLRFFRTFLETPARMPFIDRLMRITEYLLGLLIVVSLFFSGPLTADILNVLSLWTMALILISLTIRIIKKDILALVCLAGSLFYLAGTAAEILSTFISLPSTPFVVHAQLVGALLQVLFLGFALGSKTHRLRQKYQKIQMNFTRALEDKVKERTIELGEANRKLELFALTDSLTHLYNRAAMKQRCDELDEYMRRHESSEDPKSLSVIYLDLDNFKYYNDNFGHLIGDGLLRKTADCLKEKLRGYDLAYRIGGDEFLVIMPETDSGEAVQVCSRLLTYFNTTVDWEAEIRQSGSTVIQVPEDKRLSLSAGIATTNSLAFSSMEHLIHKADQALLLSKYSGKKRFHSVIY